MDFHWRDYSPIELENEIKLNPITDEKLFELMGSNKIKLTCKDMINSLDVGFTIYRGIKNKIPTYHIILNALFQDKDKIKNFTHELVRIFYCCRYDKKNSEGIEEIIKKESDILTEKYPEPIKKIFKNYSKD